MIEAILDSTSSLEFFGDNEKRAGITYRRYARAVHPDVNSDSRATEAFQKLNQYWDEYNQYHVSGKNPTAKATTGNIVYTANGEYQVVEDIQTDTFFTRYTTGKGEQVLIVSNPDDNDLAEHHAKTLKNIAKALPEENLGFYPKVLAEFTTADNLNGVVQGIPQGFVPFTQILKRYPDGIGGRDMGWIFKRVFMTLGMVHEHKIVHGGISLDSFYIHPEEHGIILNDWQYSRKTGATLSAVPFTDGYPQRFLDKEPVTPDLDMELVSKLAKELYNDDDWRITRFFKHVGTLKGKDGGFWFKELDWLLRQVYGKPTFHPFTLK